jgi:hypothetical protein
MKEKPEVSSYRSLPEEARRWLDLKRAEILLRDTQDPELGKLYEDLEVSAIRLNISRNSVRSFRDLQFLALPDKSTAGLVIDDDLYLDIIWQGAYTIDVLDRKLTNGDISESAFSTEKFKKLKIAIQQWHQSHS